jgi:hypothetical protein
LGPVDGYLEVTLKPVSIPPKLGEICLIESVGHFGIFGMEVLHFDKKLLAVVQQNTEVRSLYIRFQCIKLPSVFFCDYGAPPECSNDV